MYNSQNTADLIKKLLLNKKITAKNMCIECNLGVNTLSNIRRGDVKSVETFMTIADYLDCSVDYLLGRSATPEINQPVKEQSEEITITYAAYGAGGKTVQKKVTPEIMEKINRLMSDD